MGRGFGFAMVQLADPWFRQSGSGQFGVVVCDSCRAAFDRDYPPGMFVYAAANRAGEIARRCAPPAAQLAGPHCVRCGKAPEK